MFRLTVLEVLAHDWWRGSVLWWSTWNPRSRAIYLMAKELKGKRKHLNHIIDFKGMPPWRPPLLLPNCSFMIIRDIWASVRTGWPERSKILLPTCLVADTARCLLHSDTPCHDDAPGGRYWLSGQVTELLFCSFKHPSHHIIVAKGRHRGSSDWRQEHRLFFWRMTR